MFKKKIKTRNSLVRLCSFLRKKRCRIGFTSGVYDLIHAGHVQFLEEAKRRCDVLIVGINSDHSVKRYKGSGRPIIPLKYRMIVIAGLSAVDYIFPFSERRNHKNIEQIRPHIYFKAGDYAAEQLSSKTTVESYGGRVVILPIKFPISSSKIIAKIIKGEKPYQLNQHAGSVSLDLSQGKASPIIFLDRDGTIIEEITYLHEPEKVRLLPQALEGLKRFKAMGFKLVIITNQQGIGLGYYTKENFYSVNREIFRQVAPAGIQFDKIYFCPHVISERCHCRKPGTALIERAQADMEVNLSISYLIGDKSLDVETGRRAGIKTIAIASDHKLADGEYSVRPNFFAKDLAEAATIILEQERKA